MSIHAAAHIPGPGVRRRRPWIALLLAAAGSVAMASELAPLPEPLQLADALALASPELPALRLAAAERDASAASLTEAQSLTGFQVSAEGRLQVIEPSSLALNRDRNDSSARVALRKRLYDFGYSEALEEAARLAGDGSEWRELSARQSARLEIMRSFFDVVLADLQFARDNEAMAGAFIDADRARDRHELQRISDVALLELEAAYQQALRLRMETQSMQRLARSRLAIAMGRPGELVATVVPPAPPDLSRPVPEFELLLEDVLANNPLRKALKADVESARAELSAARNSFGPVVSGEVEAAAYERKTNSTHPFTAALVLEVPLFSGGADDAAVAAARARLQGSQARLAMHDNKLREQVLETWLQLDNLRVTLKGLGVRGEYRELYLDRSRALYELEVKTDLGDAMTEISALRLDEARAQFDWQMAQARIKALAGRLLMEER
ncbi:MAG: TolC family protein [Gammaproteobacteria bacterium]|nr:TolC family protein [Gammaproteobacteria bacterium]